MVTGREPFEFKENEHKIKHLWEKRDINFYLIENDYIRDLCKAMLERNPKKKIDARTALKKAKNF